MGDRPPPPRAPRGRLVHFLVAGLVAVCLAEAAPALAQQPSAFVAPLGGVVVDATSGTGVSGATVTLVDGGRRVFADSLGAFRFPEVPLGPWLLRIEGFGYDALLLPVTVQADMPPLEVELQPSPITLEGIDVTGEARPSAVSGVVLDDLTGQGIPFAALWLRDHQRFASDEHGAFRLPRVAPGSYLLLAQRMGYEGVYVHVQVGAEMEPVVVRLRPDPVVLEGIKVVNQRFRSRRNAYGRIVRAYGEDRLRSSGLPDMMSFLEYDAFLFFSVCDGERDGLCVLSRGSTIQPRVYIDEQYVICGLDVLQSYSPDRLYLVEVYGNGQQIRAYTEDFVESRARRPRMMEPADLPPPGLPAC